MHRTEQWFKQGQAMRVRVRREFSRSASRFKQQIVTVDRFLTYGNRYDLDGSGNKYPSQTYYCDVADTQIRSWEMTAYRKDDETWVRLSGRDSAGRYHYYIGKVDQILIERRAS